MAKINKNILVKGYGSIGKRHVNNLLALGYRPFVVTSYPDNNKSVNFISQKEIKTIQFDYAIVATPTGEHLKDFAYIAYNTGCKNFLVEKPITSTQADALRMKRIAEGKKIHIYVGYDMRFLNVFSAVKKCIMKYHSALRIVKITAGQYLPEWRLYKDYRKCYSAHACQGGGVDLDLSHELDYMLWCFGAPYKKIFTFRNKISSLDIDSCDYFKGLYAYRNFIVDVELDYIRKKERKLCLLGENKNILEVDFISQSVTLNNVGIAKKNLFDYKNAFIEEMKEFLGLLPKRRIAKLSDGIKIYSYL